MAHRSIPLPEPDEGDAFVPPHEIPSLSPRSWSRPPGRMQLPGDVAPARVAVGFVALVAAAAVGWWLLRPAAPPVESTLPTAGATAGAASSPAAAGATTTAAVTTTSADHLVAQAAGSVARPGVYRLDPGARIDDLIEQAGGFAPDADRDRINLAAPLGDGERIWVPARGEDDVPEVVAGGGGGGGGSASGGGGGTGPAAVPSPEAPVDLNSATAEQLDALPGVGPATAAAILAYRDQAGGFGTVDELLEVRGIGDAKLEQLRPLVRV